LLFLMMIACCVNTLERSLPPSIIQRRYMFFTQVFRKVRRPIMQRSGHVRSSAALVRRARRYLRDAAE